MLMSRHRQTRQSKLDAGISSCENNFVNRAFHGLSNAVKFIPCILINAVKFKNGHVGKNLKMKKE